MNDLIRRQDAIDVVAKEYKYESDRITALQKIPVVELPTWIPCSERLPDDGENVLVWFEYFRYGDYNRLFQTTGISYVFDGEWSGFVNGSSGWSKLRIIAWQPLPEPYKGETENDKS